MGRWPCWAQFCLLWERRRYRIPRFKIPALAEGSPRFFARLRRRMTRLCCVTVSSGVGKITISQPPVSEKRGDGGIWPACVWCVFGYVDVLVDMLGMKLCLREDVHGCVPSSTTLLAWLDDTTSEVSNKGRLPESCYHTGFEKPRMISVFGNDAISQFQNP